MFLPRLFSTLFLTGFISFCIIKSAGPLSFIVPLMVSFLSVIGLLEFFKMSQSKKIKANPIIISICSFFYIWILYILLMQKMPVQNIDSVFLSAIVFMSFFIRLFNKNNFKEEDSLTVNACVNVFGFIYLTWCLGFYLKILFSNVYDGRYFIFFLIFVSKSTDIFSYVFGKLLGKHKLAPVISPNKTVEGAIGGALGSFGIGMIFHFMFLKNFLSISHSVFLSILVPVVSILGDIFESMIKRDMRIKDSGGILPGLGGVLDLLDSLLLTAPFMYLYLILIF